MRDLSYNHLKEKIPTRTQLQTFDASRFIGNNLCGPQLPINCSSNDYFIMPTIISTIILIILSKNGAPQSTYQCQREIKLSVAAIKIQTAFRGYLVSLSKPFSFICVTLIPLCIIFTFTAKFLTRGFILIYLCTSDLGEVRRENFY